MKINKIDLKREYGFLQGGTLDCMLAGYPLDGEYNGRWKRPAVIVVPGGGYGMVSKREGEPVASYFFANGFHAFVLTYLTGGPEGVHYPEQLLELASAVDYVRKHAEEWYVNPDEIFVVGFSAGGHLTGNLAVEHQNAAKKAGVALDCKPTAVGLCYPVISKIHGHQGSYEYLLYGYSDEAKAELLKTLNLNEAVNEQTPPAFIWATATDNAVPADNALRYALALDQHHIAYELHVYPRCGHGRSTGSREINPADEGIERLRQWMPDCVSFFRMYIKELY